MIRRVLRIRQDDGGAALVLVLVVITVLALGLSALLSLSDTSIRTTVGLRSQASATYGSDGATQAAVNAIRNSTFDGSAGTHCFGQPDDTLHLDHFYGADSAAVKCLPDPARVPIHCTSLSVCNRPSNAILTLGTAAGEDGLHIDQPNSGSTFRVHGRIFSNSTINVTSGVLSTNTRVYARGACAGTIQSTPPPATCNYTGSDPDGPDPGYQPASGIAGVPYRALPTCNTPNSVVTFLPGYYDDAKGLSDMMAGNSSCKHSTWWFKPGPYYFDFHNTGQNANPLLSSTGGNVWTVNDGYLVAGTSTDASGTPPVAPTIPGACRNPIDPSNVQDPVPGVQFIFGGDSQFVVKAAAAEICGSYSRDTVPVAVYGLSTGSETTTALTGANALRATGATPGDFSNANASTLADAGHGFATWTATTRNARGVVTASGFAPASPIPAGSVLQSATVKVTHRHTDPTSTDDLSVSVATGAGPSLVGAVTGHPGQTPAGAFVTDSVPIDTARTGTLAAAIHAGTFTGASIAVTAGLTTKPDTDDIDAIQLELTYVAPAFRAPTGCVVAGPYTGGGSGRCAVVSTVNTSGNKFYVQGTTYVPKGVVDITLNNAIEQVFRFGLIARSAWIKLTGSFTFTGAVIEVPDDTPGSLFSVYLTTYVCPAAATCDTGGTPVLRSRVAFGDSDPAAPVAGQRQVSVLSWSRPG
ncbi:hypothetical protein ACFV9C_15890 [Kribbella sp. NPDC059898]|uniref:hypothetical protein n=1 Tax=Kribbella sp. NPDC059898 TaxID=3346995 RepID=UPI00365AE13B